MRVIGAERPGGPKALRPWDVPEPHAGPGEVGIRVRAAAVNPADVSVRAGTGRGRLLADRPGLRIPGMDAAGHVDEVGEGVTRLALGDAVMAVVLPSRPAGGAYAERIVVPEASVARIPAGTSLAVAATIPMNGLTALRALDLLALPAGATLLVTGAGGALGGYVVQLAAERGIRVVAAARAGDADRVGALGADRVATLAELGRAPLADAAVDAAVLGDPVVALVRDGGAIAAVRERADAPDVRGIRVLPVRVSEYAARADLLDELRERVERGAFAPCTAEELPAEEAARAHERLEAGGLRGRIVLAF